ncbi:MAG TPA: S-adenosylmethionine:tRNA ribosyltransferase-isomerase [Edaphocola sp.]|nr:S-adenosylmethionine:tRNA ribosyltransferase-isomerase [Edaphocola sp.]
MPQPHIHPSELRIKDFQYDLPDEKIARFPLSERDMSKLLIFKDDTIKESVYRQLADHIPSGSLLLFNQAKVIHARLYFQKPTGGKLEVFCLEPDERYPDITTAMTQEGEVYWRCLVKGAAKWKGAEALELRIDYKDNSDAVIHLKATAEKVEKKDQDFILKIKWTADSGVALSFSELLHYAGQMPIPPYLKREAEASDEIRYQTIFAEKEGSVAAPTAALHFTAEVMKRLKEKKIDTERLTLHVGAGTFMPVKSGQMKGHEMHSEWIEVSHGLVQRLISHIREDRKVIAVGTTSARTLESLYWMGVRMLRDEWDADPGIAVSQWYPYERPDEFSAMEALGALDQYFERSKKDLLITKTQLIIAPGYEIKIFDGLITNFHQPASTLLLMISALAGERWHQIYDYALGHGFRFLSYGDGCLLWCS